MKKETKAKKAQPKIRDLKARKNPKGGYNWDIPAGTASPSSRR
jgi:hypothetical protein